MKPGGPTSRRAILASHLERLDSQSCLAFVVDVWDARGYETNTDGGVLSATRDGRTTVVAPMCGRWRTARQTLSRLPDDEPIDVVVSFGPGRRGQTLAERHGARHVDSAALVEMLLYALDRPVTERLCTRHLGAALDSLRPPLRTRTHQRLTGLGRRISRAATPTPRGVVAFVVLVLVVSGGAVSLGVVESPLEQATQSTVGGTSGLDSPDEESGGTDAESTASVGTSSDEGPEPTGPAFGRDPERADIEPVEYGDVESIPGVSETGITNLTALAEAHDAALSNRSYTLWLDTYLPRDTTPNATRVQYDTDISVTEDAYLVVENADAGRDSVRLRSVYFDGRDWYVTERHNGTDQTRRIDGEEGRPPNQFDPRDQNFFLVRQYLQTRTTNVSGKIRDGNTTYYRVEGSGRPSIGGVEPVRDYRFTAFVDDDGFVSEATVAYTLVSDEGPYRVQFEWTYGNLGATTITRPSWVTNETARSETAANETVANETAANETAQKTTVNRTGDDNPPSVRP